jgi:hypothetical protein
MGRGPSRQTRRAGFARSVVTIVDFFTRQARAYQGATGHDPRPARPAVGPGLRCPGFCVFALLALPFSGNRLSQKQLWRERKTRTSIGCASVTSFCAPARRGWRASGDVGNDCRETRCRSWRSRSARTCKARARSTASPAVRRPRRQPRSSPSPWPAAIRPISRSRRMATEQPATGASAAAMGRDRLDRVQSFFRLYRFSGSIRSGRTAVLLFDVGSESPAGDHACSRLSVAALPAARSPLLSPATHAKMVHSSHDLIARTSLGG